MKRLLLTVILITTVVSCSKRKITTKSDLDYKSLKGKVESLIEYRYAIDNNEKGNIKFEIVEKYNKNGFQIENTLNVYPNGSNNNPITLKYKYDKNGFPIECMTISNGQTSDKEIMKYDESGNRIFSQRIYNGRISKTIEYKYDQRGNKIEERYFNDKDIETMKTFYRYDNNNNEIENNVYYDGQDYGKTLSKNDDFGNPVVNDVYSKEGVLSGTTHYVYEYDKMGNWIKKTKTQNNLVFNITERQINYYK